MDRSEPIAGAAARRGTRGHVAADRAGRNARHLGLVPAAHATPRTAAAQGAATEIDYARAEDAAMDYMKKLHTNIGQYAGTAPQAIQLVGQGQFVGAPNWKRIPS